MVSKRLPVRKGTKLIGAWPTFVPGGSTASQKCPPFSGGILHIECDRARLHDSRHVLSHLFFEENVGNLVDRGRRSLDGEQQARLALGAYTKDGSFLRFYRHPCGLAWRQIADGLGERDLDVYKRPSVREDAVARCAVLEAVIVCRELLRVVKSDRTNSGLTVKVMAICSSRDASRST